MILVATGAGGHAGTLNPFALVTEVRKMYSGPVVLAGSITNGLKFLLPRLWEQTSYIWVQNLYALQSVLLQRIIKT